MKTLQQLKDEFAKEKGEFNWNDFKLAFHASELEPALDEINKRFYNQQPIKEKEELIQLAREYIKPFKHTLHLGEEEGFINDLVNFAEWLQPIINQQSCSA